MTINYVDTATIIILAISIANMRRKGVTYFIAAILSRLISLFASIMLYGSVSSFLRETALFDMIKAKAGEIVNVEIILRGMAGENGPSFITFPDKADEASPVYDFMSMAVENIIANDNSEIYELFNVNTYQDYVNSYLANVAINIISVIVVYFIVSFIIKFIFGANRVVSRLPVIKQVNALTGFIAGLVQGTIIIWILMLALIYFALQGKALGVYDQLLTSHIAIYFLKYNIFAKIIFNISP